MWRKGLTGAVVALGVLGVAAAANAQWSRQVVGKWSAQATSASGSMQTCDIELKSDEWFGGYRASSFRCSGELFGVNKWQARGSSVVLLGGGGKELATLSLRGDRLVGQDADGKPVTMTRAGAPPSLPAPAPRAGAGHDGGWSTSWGRPARDCVRYGDASRCATEAEQRPPSIMTVTGQDLLASPQRSARSLANVPRDVCLPVAECRSEGGDMWCRVSYRGQNGYLRQVETGRGPDRLMFKNSCD